MKQSHFFELDDQSWLPQQILDASTDGLRFKWEILKLNMTIVPRLQEVLLKTGDQEIIDLESEGGGPAVAIHRELAKSDCDVLLALTDKFPNVAAFRYAREQSVGEVDFLDESVDATAVPSHLQVLRTLFASLHHFQPELVRSILQDAVDRRCPIAIFDFSPRVPPPPLLLLMSTPPGELLTTPFMQPFRWSCLFWTYVIPVVPFYVAWYAFVSGLRLHSLEELQTLVKGLRSDDYAWAIGREASALWLTYLIGCPT